MPNTRAHHAVFFSPSFRRTNPLATLFSEARKSVDELIRSLSGTLKRLATVRKEIEQRESEKPKDD